MSFSHNQKLIFSCMLALGAIEFSSAANAAAFQIWEQSGASIGNYHAGYAAEAGDASTAFFNPAGITRFQNQQLVVGGAAIMSSFKYRGSVNVMTPITAFGSNAVTAQGGTFSVVPDLHYVAPISDCVGFGFSIDVPFGLKTSYNDDTFIQYAATFSQINVVDYSPDLALQFTDKASVGAGFDIQRMDLQLDNTSLNPIFIGPIPIGVKNTSVSNKLNDTGYGGHFGLLYQFTPETRVGVSYHTHVSHHLTGDSNFSAMLKSDNTWTNINLPAYTSAGVYSQVAPQWALMGNVIYTEWDTFKQLVLHNAAGYTATGPSRSIVVVSPQHYRNTWNLSGGADYLATERMTLKGGLGYDESPIRNAYRTVVLPDNNRFIIALGAHYDASKRVGLDIGWSHFFIKESKVNPPAQVTGVQSTTTNGHVTGGADVLGGQVTWNIV